MSKNKKTLILIIVNVIILVAVAIIMHFVQMPDYAKIIVYTIFYLEVAYKVLWKAVKNISHGKVFDENFLMAIASIGAMIMGEFNEALAVILFYQVGELFEKVAVGKTRQSIADLMDIAPSFANVYCNGTWEEKELEEVVVGDSILVKMGERVPVDGVITKGDSSLETSALTGESMPRSVKEGDNILSGCVNIGNAFEMKAEKEYSDSTVSKILELVENSSSRKSKSEQFITKFAKYYTPAVVAVAVLIAIIPSLITKDWREWINRALIFLMVSCPCALVISVPLGFFAGIGSASKLGVLVKGSNYLEQLNKANVILMDKTGTITKGSFEIEKINTDIDKEEFIKILASIERYSNHPIAKSINAFYKGDLYECEVEEISGKGLKSELNGSTYYVGNFDLIDDIDLQAEKVEDIGTVVYMAKDDKVIGYVIVNDTLKDDSEEAIKSLKKLGCRIVMLTGDNEKVAKKIADEVGIEYRAELLPQDKVGVLEEMISNKDKSTTIAFAGDGINDAPSLSRADVGIAMGGVGSEVAIEAADIVLMKDNLGAIVSAKKVAKKTMGIVKQNIVFALVVKFAIMILSAFGIGNMWIAVFADVVVSVIAILNSMRCLKQKSDKLKTSI